MVSGLITDDQITASSHTDRSWAPENARLLTSRSGWTLLPQPQPYIDEWLQVDLGQEKLMRGLIIQGGKHRENKVFMKKFRLGYSSNGSDWNMVMETNTNKPKVRIGVRIRSAQIVNESVWNDNTTIGPVYLFVFI